MKKGPSPKKEEKRSPAKAPVEEAPKEAVMEMPRFTNTKKKDDKPTFAKLESVEKDRDRESELTSQPYTEKGSREFMVKPRQLLW
jgi:hypothetical protein